MNAGLRAQAGGPLGLSWGLSVLNLFWKQRKKTRELLWGTQQKGLHNKIHTSGDPGHSLGVSRHALPTPSSPSNPVQAPTLRASFPKALRVEYFYREDVWSLPRIFIQEAFYRTHWLNPIIHNLWVP